MSSRPNSNCWGKLNLVSTATSCCKHRNTLSKDHLRLSSDDIRTMSSTLPSPLHATSGTNHRREALGPHAGPSSQRSFQLWSLSMHPLRRSMPPAASAKPLFVCLCGCYSYIFCFVSKPLLHHSMPFSLVSVFSSWLVVLLSSTSTFSCGVAVAALLGTWNGRA